MFYTMSANKLQITLISTNVKTTYFVMNIKDFKG